MTRQLVDYLGPRSTALMCLSVSLAIALIVVTVACWDRGRLRLVRRWLSLCLSQALLLVAAFVMVNQQIAFYATWRDVFGGVR